MFLWIYRKNHCVLLLLPLFFVGAAGAVPWLTLLDGDLLSCVWEELRLWLSVEEELCDFAELEDWDLLELCVLFCVLLLLLDDFVAGAAVALAGIELSYSCSARSSRARSLALSWMPSVSASVVRSLRRSGIQ